MDKQFWINRWLNRQIGFHQTKFSPYLKHYNFSSIDNVLVPLCGKSLDLLYLAKKCHNVVGIEIAKIAVDEFFADNNLHPKITNTAIFTSYQDYNIELLLGDFFNFTYQQAKNITVVFDRAALIALPPELRIKYAQKINQLKINTILLVTLEYPPAEKSGPPFSVSKSEAQVLFGKNYHIKLLECNPNSEDKFADLSYMNEAVYLLKLKKI